MSQPIINMELTVPDIQQLKTNAVRLAHKEAALKVMAWFLEKRLHKRFDGSASQELDYEQRDPHWITGRQIRIRKRAFDHNFSGRTFQTVKRTAKVKATSNREGVNKMSITADGLGYQYGRRKGGKIDMRDELERVSDAEGKELAEMYLANFVDFLNNNPKARYKKTIKVKGDI